MTARRKPLEREWLELETVLDEELSRLPADLRAPLVLCYLNRMTHDEIARRLGLHSELFAERLRVGREALQERLKDRGLSLSPQVLALLLSQRTTAEPVPAKLVDSTVEMAIVGVARPESGRSVR